MRPLVSMRQALGDPDLFGAILAGESWATWRVLLIAIPGEELTPEERVVFEALTGRPTEPGQPVEEATLIKGRRAGGTRAIAVLAAYYAGLCDHAAILAPGERATLPIMSASTWQAAKMLQYLDGIFSTVPAMRALVTGQTNDSISLSTLVDIECAAASFRTIRGGTAVAVVADEAAFWRNELTANPDSEILAAARPMLATTNGPLIVVSSPYAKRGEVWNAFRRDYGPNGDPLILVVKGASRTFNPTLSEHVVARAYERDPASAAAEYGGDFRVDIEALFSRDAVDAAVVPGRLELPPIVEGLRYYAFVDPSGGAQDSMTIAVAHVEGDTAILDAVREVKPPFSPDNVVGDFVDLLRRYRLSEVTGDRYGGEFTQEQFKRRGVTYRVSERSKSEIYRELLPLLNSRRIELLDLPHLHGQLLGLERRTGRGTGRDNIDHGPNGHDDIANAAAGALVRAAGIGRTGFDIDLYARAYS